ncbi:hypothetical protein RB2150_04713 [Rhodobacterales bacterium HTCC2150]|nr:hypothetical protein RB2150_04713 [Rhodobacterales bacterium HTCC2150] [Rhodobacteraceae bacterium HTCC2150]
MINSDALTFDEFENEKIFVLQAKKLFRLTDCFEFGFLFKRNQ